MYLGFYGLGKAPFHVTPDPEFLFLSPSHREAYASIVYGVSSRKGFLTLTGEVGTGKTTILRAYLRHVKDSDVCAIYLFNPDISFEELLRQILHEMGIESEDQPVTRMLQQLHERLVQEYRDNHNVVLVIDEAQNMPIETLEKLRMLSNVETTTDKLLQIILVGQPELDEKLSRHELRQLRQRIAVRATLQELTFSESLGYMHHRIAQADGHYERVLDPAAAKIIARQARGNPRVLNILCDNALVAGFGYQRRPVTAEIAREVIGDYEGSWRNAQIRWAGTAVAACLFVCAFLFVPWGRIREMVRHSTDAGTARAQSLPEKNAGTGDSGVPAANTEVQRPETAGAAAHKPRLSDPVSRQSDVALDVMLKSMPERYSRVIPPDMGNYVEAIPEPVPAAVVPSADAPAPTPVKENVSAVPAGPIVPPSPAAPTPSVQESTDVAREVMVGDCLTSLITEVYGRCDTNLITLVKERNPQIEDIDCVLIGDTLIFPNVPVKAAPKTN